MNLFGDIPASAWSQALRPSSSKRWMTCPGSAVYSLMVDPDKSSSAALEGSEAHAYAERLGEFANALGPFFGGDPVLLHGAAEELRQEEPEEMLGHVVDYVAACFAKAVEYGQLNFWFELRLEMPFLSPGGKGTADFVAYNPEGGAVFIGDLKYGAGIRVPAQGNYQLMTYLRAAIGFLEKSGFKVDRSKMTMGIFQPRIVYGWQTHTLSEEEFSEFCDKQDAALAEAKSDSPSFKASEECRFCPARGHCPELQKDAVQTLDFRALVPDGKGFRVNTSPEHAAKVLEHAERMEIYIKAIKDTALEMAIGGKEIPGYVLVESQGRSQVIDEAGLLETIMDITGKDPRVLVMPGITDAKSFLRANSPQKMTVKQAEEIVGRFSGRNPGKPQLKPASSADARVRQLSAASMFEKLED